MNDIPRDKLIEIINQSGQDVIKNPQRVKGMLMDSCGECRREIHALMTALTEGIVSDLCSNPGNIPPTIWIANLRRKLLHVSSMAEDLAQWTIESWAIALGVIPAGQGTQPSSAPRPVQSRPVPPPSPQPAVVTPPTVQAPPVTVPHSAPAPAIGKSGAIVWILAHRRNMIPIGLGIIGLCVIGFFILNNLSPRPDAPAPTPAPTITRTPPPGMVLIPAGAFQMGSLQGDYDEKPVHSVTLSAFWIDRYEVTHANYAKCVADLKCSPPDPTRSFTRENYYGDSQYANYPVLYVTWDQANTYCQWRGAQLPTEAEWEKAARGGLEGKTYPWGDETPVCTPGAKNGTQFRDCSLQDSVAVGSFSPNDYGVYDMVGNVWEWVNDWYDGQYYGVSPARNPTGPTYGQYRVLRGGGWDVILHSVRVADRNYYSPANGKENIGFRCVAH